MKHVEPDTTVLSAMCRERMHFLPIPPFCPANGFRRGSSSGIRLGRSALPYGLSPVRETSQHCVLRLRGQCW